MALIAFTTSLLLLLCSCSTMVAATKEKTTHIHFYMHDRVTGPDPTATLVVQGPNTGADNSTGPALQFRFGDILVFDDPLTKGPSPSSELLGRGQGHYALSSREEFCLTLVMNVAFTSGKHNGSTLAMMARRPVTTEVPVLGGTGRFRLARGYAETRFYYFNATSGNAIIEFNLTVLHH